MSYNNFIMSCTNVMCIRTLNSKRKVYSLKNSADCPRTNNHSLKYFINCYIWSLKNWRQSLIYHFCYNFH